MLDHVEQHGHGGQHPTRLPRLLVVLDALEEGYVGTGFGGGLETPDGLVEAVCLECIRAGNNDNVRSQAAAGLGGGADPLYKGVCVDDGLAA